MALATAVSMGGLAIAALLCLARLVAADTVADRIVALDSALIVISGGIAIHGVRTGTDAYSRLLFVTVLMGFIGTVAVARFVERRGS